MGLRGPGASPLAAKKLALADYPGPLPWEKPGQSRYQRIVAFLQDLTITAGSETGKKLKVRGFQHKFLRKTYREDHGRRPVRTAVQSLARKNGKTQLAAGLALAHLCGPEAESRGEVYSCANDRFQASKIFHEMCAMILAHPYLEARTNIVYHRKEIIDLITGSVYAALSREAKTKMGLSPSF